MLSEDDLQALEHARHPDPFAVLGMRCNPEGQWWVRAFLPDAQQVEVVDARSGRRVARLHERGATGLFEGAMARRRRAFDYRLRTQWRQGDATELADPYAYGPLIDEADLSALAQGTHLRAHEVLGAHPMTLGDGPQAVHGVRFAVWAPNATRVSVVGDFNAWDGRRHPMRGRGGSGVWELFVPHVQVGDLYKFEVRSAQGEVLPLKIDPYARATQSRPDTACVVAPGLGPRPAPRPAPTSALRQQPLSIYEVHASSWRRHPDGRFYSWDELAQSLPAYAADLGFTHIELLPVSEHPLDASWGYQSLGLFAPTARMGDPAGWHRFVSACREHGLGLLVDWVPAHFPADAHGLAQFDGTALYEYADPREGFHPDWNTLIYNYARHEVRNFLASSALYWVERMGADGLRVDAVASMLYRDYSRAPGQWIANVHGGRENLEAMALLRYLNEALGREQPAAFTVAEESTAFAGVSAPTWAGGLGFHFKWNMGWMNDTLRYMAQDPVHRRWHHERMTFGLMYAFSENFVLPLSHDEVVHGKGSLLARMPGDEWQRRANLRAYYGFMWGHPGKKLLFMGQEFAQGTEWDHGSELPWWLLRYDHHRGVQHLIRDLNGLYRQESALHQLDCEASGFEWIDAHDASSCVLSWLRQDAAGRRVIVVANMTPVVRQNFRLGVPDGTTAWREVLNTDAAVYGGSNAGNGSQALPVQAVPWHARAQSICLTLPPLATLFLSPC